MKDSTKRRIAFEISYFYKLFKYKGLPLLFAVVLKLLSEDCFNVINKVDLYSGEDATIILFVGLALTVPLLYIPYIVRLMQWVKKTNGNKNYLATDWQVSDRLLLIVYLLFLNLIICALIIKFDFGSDVCWWYFCVSFVSSFYGFLDQITPEPV